MLSLLGYMSSDEDSGLSAEEDGGGIVRAGTGGGLGTGAVRKRPIEEVSDVEDIGEDLADRKGVAEAKPEAAVEDQSLLVQFLANLPESKSDKKSKKEKKRKEKKKKKKKVLELPLLKPVDESILEEEEKEKESKGKKLKFNAPTSFLESLTNPKFDMLLEEEEDFGDDEVEDVPVISGNEIYRVIEEEEPQPVKEEIKEVPQEEVKKKVFKSHSMLLPPQVSAAPTNRQLVSELTSEVKPTTKADPKRKFVPLVQPKAKEEPSAPVSPPKEPKGPQVRSIHDEVCHEPVETFPSSTSEIPLTETHDEFEAIEPVMEEEEQVKPQPKIGLSKSEQREVFRVTRLKPSFIPLNNLNTLKLFPLPPHILSGLTSLVHHMLDRMRQAGPDCLIQDVVSIDTLAGHEDAVSFARVDRKTASVRDAANSGFNPNSVQKRKHQITALAWQYKQDEFELREKFGSGRNHRMQAKAKYGW